MLNIGCIDMHSSLAVQGIDICLWHVYCTLSVSNIPEVRDSVKGAKSLKAHKDLAVCINVHGVMLQHSFLGSLVQSWKYYPWTNTHKLTYVF